MVEEASETKMHFFESRLSKEEFFKRVGELDLDNVLVLKERYSDGVREKPTGFVVDGVKLLLFVSHWGSVLVGLGYEKKEYVKADRLREHLELEPYDSFSLKVDYPSDEVMKAWRNKER